ncbi:MAG: transglutaminaseTgpA domain-containing protein, partial [Streptomyces sp.]|uniref:transglutaminase family protein n=1 Tax=Streptomyces sp. TaxID=1931 RepID=UPI003D6B718F
MSGRGRLALCAALATIAAACALLPLVDPATWLLQAALLVGVQTLVGAATRRVPLARPLTVAAQVLVSLLLLTFFFTREVAVGGLLPGPDVFEEFGRLLAEGGQDVGRFAIPAPVTDGIRLMLVGGVLVIGLLVDALAVTFRSAAPAGLPLLALYSIAAGLSQGGARWLWFLCAAGGYLLLLLAEGRERLSQWGRVFTDRGRPGAPAFQPGAPRGPAMAPVRTGRRIGALALGIALAVPAVLPSLGTGLLDAARSGGSGAGGNGSGTVSAVNPLVALQDSLNQPEDRTALTYSTDAKSTAEMYLRIVALDQFDGAAWKPSQRRIGAVPGTLPDPPGLDSDVRTQRVRSSVAAADWYSQNWLPMPYPASRVRIDGRWRFEPAGRTLVGDRGQTTRGARYQVESLLVQPTARQLRDAPAPPPEMRQEYTKVPESLPSVVRRTALRVTRGAADDYERAVRIQDWFALNGGFTYDTRVRAGSGSAAIVNFLEEKEGFCVHFAFSMAAMARTLGIPARVAVGFTPGTADSEGRMAVGLKDAHAWPELYFEGVGWTRFEPTPTRGSAPPYAQPDSPDVSENPAEQLPERGRTPEPQPTPSETDRCTAEQKRLDPQCGQAAPAPGSGGTDGGFPVGTAAGLTLAALLVLGLPLLPMLWRARTRARRLGARGSPGPDPEAGPGDAVLAAWHELVDSGWDYGVVPDESATPRAAAARIARIGDLGTEAAEAAQRVAHAVEH